MTRMMRESGEIAPVRPRLVSGQLLEEEFEELLARDPSGRVAIEGPPLSGRTTALRHLCALFGDRAGIAWLDGDPFSGHEESLVVHTTARASDRAAARYALAPWGEDEWIEYLLSTSRDRCGSVIERLRRNPDRGFAGGSPALWRIVLDEMAADESIEDARSALRAGVLARYAPTELLGIGDRILLDGLGESTPIGPDRLFALRQVSVIVAADRLVERVACRSLGVRLTTGFLQHEILSEAGRIAAASPQALERLDELASASSAVWHATAASVLVASEIGWVPRSAPMDLDGAFLQAVRWPRVDLHGSDLRLANLRGADLTEANLAEVESSGANLSEAWLVRANLRGLRATGASLVQAVLAAADATGACFKGAQLTSCDLSETILVKADLTRADLRRACLAEAMLSESKLVDARIDGADFSGASLRDCYGAGLPLRRARLEGASFVGAVLVGCDLEGVQLDRPDFEGAFLVLAEMSRSRMMNPCFRGAELMNTGLADIDWEGADLREANLDGASFHLGSSRSGLVPAGLPPLEGSRTGFYRDAEIDLECCDPALVRRANLRFANLLGAKVEGTDFLLVDLRGALYDAAQREHFRRCGAILSPT